MIDHQTPEDPDQYVHTSDLYKRGQSAFIHTPSKFQQDGPVIILFREAGPEHYRCQHLNGFQNSYYPIQMSRQKPLHYDQVQPI